MNGEYNAHTGLEQTSKPSVLIKGLGTLGFYFLLLLTKDALNRSK